MYRQVTSLALFAAIASACTAPQGEYAQCGGENFTGGTTCIAGWTCVLQNPFYSQCLPGSSSSAAAPVASTPASSSAAAPVASEPATSSAAPPVVSASTVPTTVAAAVPATSTTSTSPATSSTALASTGQTFKSSFTMYGAGDTFGSPNCQTDTAACGFFTSPGFAAAVSQNLYGVGPGAGAGPACGTCWQLTGETDSSGNALTNAGTSIIVMINNLCPADGNPLCAQNGLTGTNQYGANVNFDLCIDSGASAAFFGSDGEGLAVGTATEVSCSEYSGTVVH